MCVNEDNEDYYRFTGRQRLDKAMHTLEGIAQGIAIDGKVNSKELGLITAWVGRHQEFAKFHPFNQLIPRLTEIVSDGIIDEEEIADIIWLCNKFTTDEDFFDHITSDMQRLQGILGGIAADQLITEEELNGLQVWLEMHSHLRTCWPYDELESLVLSVLKDGMIDAAEHAHLMAFFKEFTKLPGHSAVNVLNAQDAALPGICAVCPEIVFDGRVFCFTGKSNRFTRKHFAAIVQECGAKFSARVTDEVNYLAIGDEGNPCWAYSCYGRKVEQAIEKRKAGSRILLIHEFDLWDAIQDLHG